MKSPEQQKSFEIGSKAMVRALVATLMLAPAAIHAGEFHSEFHGTNVRGPMYRGTICVDGNCTTYDSEEVTPVEPMSLQQPGEGVIEYNKRLARERPDLYPLWQTPSVVSQDRLAPTSEPAGLMPMGFNPQTNQFDFGVTSDRLPPSGFDTIGPLDPQRDLNGFGPIDR